MKQLLHIHGGEWFDSYEEYIETLKAWEIDDPREPKDLKWRDQYEEVLGDEWLVIRPKMPSPMNAKYIEWEIWFEKYFSYLDDGVVLVGHSLGATFLAQYLCNNEFPKKIQSLHLVAPAYDGKGGFGVPPDVSKLERNVQNIYMYHSRDDHLVSYNDAVKLKELFPEAELVTFEDRGHLLTPEFPELIERIKN